MRDGFRGRLCGVNVFETFHQSNLFRKDFDLRILRFKEC